MKRPAAVFAGALLVLVSAAQPDAAPQWSEAAAAELDARLRSVVEDEAAVGAAVGLVVGDELVFARGYGVAELGGQRPITPRSVFHWASVSKPLVAVAVMQLAESEALALDDPLLRWLPYFRMDDDRLPDVTLRHLLTHTAGVPDVADYEWDEPQTDEGALKRWALEQSDRELLFDPGSERAYSNIGFELLGLVVQEVSGMTFERYMSQRIFEPLSMSDSSFIADEIDPVLRVKGHVGAVLRHTAAAYPYNRRHAPSSTLNSNIEDMSRFALAMLHGGRLGDARILGADAMQEMWSVAWVSPEDQEKTASLGWNVGRPWGGILSASHGGHDDGFRSFLYIAPEEGVAVLLASNDDTISTGAFVLAVLEAVFPEQAAIEASQRGN